jgi:hypothetical protein
MDGYDAVTVTVAYGVGKYRVGVVDVDQKQWKAMEFVSFQPQRPRRQVARAAKSALAVLQTFWNTEYNSHSDLRLCVAGQLI